MSQLTGSKRTCRFCGQPYRRTNFMVRRGTDGLDAHEGPCKARLEAETRPTGFYFLAGNIYFLTPRKLVWRQGDVFISEDWVRIKKLPKNARPCDHLEVHEERSAHAYIEMVSGEKLAR